MARITVQITASDMTPATLPYSEFSHYSDSQDVESIAQHFGILQDEFSSFFVSYTDGDYGTVYGCHYAFPTNFAQLYKVELIHS